jgi:hypothetical protein
VIGSWVTYGGCPSHHVCPRNGQLPGPSNNRSYLFPRRQAVLGASNDILGSPIFFSLLYYNREKGASNARATTLSLTFLAPQRLSPHLDPYIGDHSFLLRFCSLACPHALLHVQRRRSPAWFLVLLPFRKSKCANTRPSFSPHFCCMSHGQLID